MKQPLLWLVLFAGMFFSSTAQTNLTPLLSDSSHFYYYDAASGNLQFWTKSYQTYNSDNLPLISYNHNTFGGTTTYYQNVNEYNAEKLLTRYTTLKSDLSASGPWENFLKEELTYDAQDRNNYFIGQFGSGATWENYYQQTTWFDDAASADSSLYQLWNAGSSSWTNYRRHFNGYYPNGLQAAYINDEWLEDFGVWRNLEKEYFTYYPNETPETHISITNFSSGNIYTVRDSFIYRPDGLLDTTFVTTQFSSTGTPNFLYRKYKYTPDGKLTREDSYIKTFGVWTPSSRFTYEPAEGVYSEDPLYVLAESYDESSQSFYPLWSIERQYELLGNGSVLFVEVNKQRDLQGQLAVQSIDSTWYRPLTVGVNSPAVHTQADCDFANPYTPGSSIVCHAEAPDPLTVQLYNTFGQMVLQTRVMPGEAWRPNVALPGGLYTLTVWQQGQYLGVRKMMVR